MLRKYVSVCMYVPSRGEDYTGVVNRCEPDQAPSMRQILERHVAGLPPEVRVYDEWDDSEPWLEPGDDKIDALRKAHAHIEYIREKQEKDKQLSQIKNDEKIAEAADLAKGVTPPSLPDTKEPTLSKEHSVAE